jgi:hypothetical protein
MWWRHFLWGFWHGLTAWLVVLVHACGGWRQYPVYNRQRRSNWYALGFVLGAATPLRGASGRRRRRGPATR